MAAWLTGCTLINKGTSSSRQLVARRWRGPSVGPCSDGGRSNESATAQGDEAQAAQGSKGYAPPYFRHRCRPKTQVARLSRELKEALEQQAATSEVLQVISNSAGELEPVFQAMLASAIRICEAKFGTLLLLEEEELRLVAMAGTPREFGDFRRRDPTVPAYVRRLVETRQIVHIANIAEEEP